MDDVTHSDRQLDVSPAVRRLGDQQHGGHQTERVGRRQEKGHQAVEIVGATAAAPEEAGEDGLLGGGKSAHMGEKARIALSHPVGIRRLERLGGKRVVQSGRADRRRGEGGRGITRAMAGERSGSGTQQGRTRRREGHGRAGGTAVVTHEYGKEPGKGGRSGRIVRGKGQRTRRNGRRHERDANDAQQAAARACMHRTPRDKDTSQERT